MKAMILAAGLGTRLKPLTDSIPKAMVPLLGKPLLYYVIEKLKMAGVYQIIINVHHFPETIIDYVEENKGFGLEIAFSREDTLLDTGGGVKNAARFFNDGQPFILHNVDVLSGINLKEMLFFHQTENSIATISVRKRKTSRYFLFDNNNQLVGWQSLDTGETDIVVPVDQNPINLSFMGIHILSPEIFNFMPDEKTFSIIKAYLDLAKKGYRIRGYRNDEDYWIDLGKEENLHQAEEYLLLKK